MKTTAYLRVLFVSLSGLVVPGFGQNLGFSDPSPNGFPPDVSAPSHWLVGTTLPAPGCPLPVVEPASPGVPETALLIQGRSPEARSRHEVADCGNRPADFARALSKPSRLLELAKNPAQPGLEASVRELQLGLALLTAVYRPQGEKVATADCPLLAMVVQRRVAAEPARTLEIVQQEVGLNPNCACEIVKAAITGSEADATQVAAIVETACLAAPDMMRIISQCAIATVPDALERVQAVLAKLDPNAGSAGNRSKSAKSAKSSKAKIVIISAANPLDLPPLGPPVVPPPVSPLFRRR